MWVLPRTGIQQPPQIHKGEGLQEENTLVDAQNAIECEVLRETS